MPDEVAGRHLVDRKFVAEARNALWITDPTYVPTWSGLAYVCFIVDAYLRNDRGVAVRVKHAHR